MTRSLASRLLWFTFVLCLPLPFFLVEVAHEPVAAMVQMLVVTLVLVATEGSSGAAALAAWMLAVQALLAMALLALLSALVVRAIDRIAGARRGAVLVTLVVAIFAIALTQPIYRTPFRTAGLHATLAEVFE